VGKFEVNPLDIAAAEAGNEAAKSLSNENHCESFQVQVIGRRRVLLISPDVSYKGLYPYPTSHPFDGSAIADLDDADYSKHPRLAQVRGASAICEPGDVLFVPDSWWRHEHGLTSEHASVEIRVGESLFLFPSFFLFTSGQLERLTFLFNSYRNWRSASDCGGGRVARGPPRGGSRDPRGRPA
jgi:hypothetical protein